MQTQARKRFLHSLDSSIDNVLLLTNTGSTSHFWLYKHSQTSSGRHTAARQSNRVIYLLLGPTH